MGAVVHPLRTAVDMSICFEMITMRLSMNPSAFVANATCNKSCAVRNASTCKTMRSIVGVVKINAKTESIAIKVSVFLPLNVKFLVNCVQTKKG